MDYLKWYGANNISSYLTCTWKTVSSSHDTFTMRRVLLVQCTLSNSATIWFKAYLNTFPSSLMYKVTLKTCPTTCVLVSKDALISVYCSVIMLFMASQTLHRSPRLFCNTIFLKSNEQIQPYILNLQKALNKYNN